MPGTIMMAVPEPHRPRENHDVQEVWLPLLLLMALGWTWYHVFRLRERATLHARRLCERHGLQFLDGSVALHRVRARWRNRALHVTREYRFDVSPGGHDRQTATITLFRDRVVATRLPTQGTTSPAPPVATSPFLSRTLPGGEASATGNVVPFDRRRRTLH